MRLHAWTKGEDREVIMDQQPFEQMYHGQAPWDTGRPQPAIVRLAEAGQIHGNVLDVGCGTGENVLYLAAGGHDAWGIDFVPLAIERATAKAAERESTPISSLGTHWNLASSAGSSTP